MRIMRMKKTIALGVLLTIMLIALYHRYGSSSLIAEDIERDHSISSIFPESAEKNSHFNTAVQHESSKTESSKDFLAINDAKENLENTFNQNSAIVSKPSNSDRLVAPQNANHSKTVSYDQTEKEMKPMQDDFIGRCWNTSGIHENNADIQVSDLVEKLSFQSEDTNHGQFRNLQPIPKSEKLTVFLVPHSHCDPGWIETYDYYYTRDVRRLLTNLYQFAMEHHDFKYIYAEVSFFSLWWKEQSDNVRQNMKQLAREGRFEFVQGGWVQNDEANTHYFAILNQMLDGHEWLKKNFPEAVPRIGWAIDPFGLSPFMAQINSMFGFGAMHIQRVHYSVKRHLAENKQIEFRWRQSWDWKGETDILTQMGPFTGYNSQSTCGPDPDICLHYHFAAFTNPKFSKDRNLVRTTSSNVKERSLKILDQWRKKAALHSANAVFIETGFDFSYIFKESISEVYNNYKPMMEYINNDPDLNTQVKWGTVSEYFDHIKNSNVKFPILSGDFFTYSDRLDHYWSGYFTTRPFFKNLDRVLESSLRRTEVLFAFHRAKTSTDKLTSARNILSLFQHHDAITGTAQRKVVNDYADKLLRAYNTCEEVSTEAIQNIMGTSGFQPTKHRPGIKDMEKLRILDKTVELLISSTLARRLTAVQVISVNSQHNFQVMRSDESTVPQQIEPAVEYGKFDSGSKHLVFWTDLPSVSISAFKVIDSGEDQAERVNVELYNFNSKSLAMSLESKFHTVSYDSSCNDIVLGGEKVAITLDCKSSRVKKLKTDEREVAVVQDVLLYSDKGGAYLFLPGSTSQLLTDSSRPEIIVTRGPIRDKAVVTLKFLSSTMVLTYIVNHHVGIEGGYVELQTMVDLRNSGDLAIRFKTDIASGDSIFTDLNGHTIQQHKYKSKLHTQGNFFPMPSTAFIQDSSMRLSILSSEPHGVASLDQGWIEIIIDRRTSQDDLRGLGESINDNVPTPAGFRILVEPRAEKPPSTDLYLVEFPSLASYWTLQSLQHPAFIVSGALGQLKNQTTTMQLMKSLPCDEELVNFRYVQNQTCQLIRRKLGFTCAINTISSCDYQDLQLSELFRETVWIEEHPFSPLHQASESKASNFKAMQFSSQYVTFNSQPND
ncbi:hypothetical protein ACHWQZ_G009923 [Mnemiopsis leidyi]